MRHSLKSFLRFPFFLISLLFLSAHCISKETGDSLGNRMHSIVTNEENITVTKKYDPASDTHYYLTKVKHKDSQGRLLALEHAHAAKKTGETVPEFSERMGRPLLAINASTMTALSDGIEPRGVQIIDGTVIQEKLLSNRYTLGIKYDNELVAFEPGVGAKKMLKSGVKHALTAFIVLIDNHEPIPEELQQSASTFANKHPRQVIAQMDNLDLLILSCGGRGFDGAGMTAGDLIRVLQQEGVRFAYMLDGGGSTSTVVRGTLITPRIDKQGTKDRLRPNFLYISNAQ